MKKSLYIFLLIAIYVSGQQNKKTVTLYFDISSVEMCEVEIEGKENQLIKKYRVSDRTKNKRFFICDEKFDPIDNKAIFLDSTEIKQIRFVDLSYILQEKKESYLKYNPFEKIFIVKKESPNVFSKYQVYWIDEWIEVD